MFDALTANALAQIDVVEELIRIHDAVADTREAEQRKGIKLYAVSSCVTRLYAIYEKYVESAMSDFLAAMPELHPYATLAEGLKTEYRIGISQVLSKIDSERYRHLGHERVVRWYHDALTSASSYRFVPEALTRHEQNLRLQTLDTLLSRIQLSEFRGWLAREPGTVALYTEKSAVYEQLDAEVRSFVQLRNEAAHGELQELQGKDNLLRLCMLLRALVVAIASYMRKSLLEERQRAGRVRLIGRVTEVFGKAGAFVARVNAASVVRKGSRLHLLGTNYCHSVDVHTVMVDDVEVEAAVADRDEYEVGIACTTLPREKAEIYVDVAPASPATTGVL